MLMFSRRRATHLLPIFFLSWLLQACGGGGGSDAPAAPPGGGGSAARLQNAIDPATVGIETGDATLQLAQLARGALVNIGVQPRASVQRMCSGGQGSVIYAWSDLDGNARWSRGDTATATYAGCKVPRVAHVINGRFVATFATDPDADLLSWSLVVRTDNTLSLSSQGRAINGELGVAFAATATTERLSLSPIGTAPVTVTTRWGQTVEVRVPGSSIELRYDLAQSHVRLDFEMQNSLVGGIAFVRTIQPFVTGVRVVQGSHKQPVSGELHIVGADADRVEVRAAVSQFSYQLVRGASGPQGAPGYQLWGVAANDALWWIGSHLRDDEWSHIETYSIAFTCSITCNDQAYADEATGRAYLRAYFPESVTATTGYVVQLVDVGSEPPTGALDGRGPVSAEVTLTGAAVTIRPTVTLEPGRRYEVRGSLGSLAYASGATAFGSGTLLQVSSRRP